MSIKILAIISFLLPFTVSILGALAIFGNRHRGFSRNLLSVVFLGITYFFAYLVIARLDLDWIQVAAFNIYTPILFAVAPGIYLFQKSLMQPKYRIKNSEWWNFGSALVILFLTIVTTMLFGLSDMYLVVSTERTGELQGFIDTSSYVIKGIVTLGVIVFSLFFYKKTETLFENQKKKYKKFYADYEKRNEMLGKSAMRIWILILIIESFLLWYGASSGILVIGAKLIDSVGLLIMIKFGIEQIDIRRYRMYKLSSHEHELD